jgi:hypothetical protein
MRLNTASEPGSMRLTIGTRAAAVAGFAIAIYYF